MQVWLTIPSVRPLHEAANCVMRWMAMGYKIAILRQGDLLPNIDLQIPTGTYLGWARSTNILCREVMRRDPDAQWCVGGGDDYHPDAANHACEIGNDCWNHFAGINGHDHGTWGVMQPIGDRWQANASGENALIDRVAGSPWMGREWIERSYLGDGPMWSGYLHNFADEELQAVATKAGVFWQRRDLIQYHDHDLRGAGKPEIPVERAWIYHEYGKARPIFEARKAAGWPGSGVIR